MSKSLAELTTHLEPELVCAIVSPVGTDLDGFQNLFTDLVKQFGYSVQPLRLSEMAHRLHVEKIGDPLDLANDHARINSLMSAGNSLRKLAGRDDVLALHAIAEIRKKRKVTEGRTEPIPKTIHLLRSLKHPEEVEALRRVYGAGFFLIGLQATEGQQTDYLVQRKGMSPEQAAQLISRDRDENQPYGQHTRDTFTLADVFVRASDEDTQQQLQRFLELVFGFPYWTPTLDEYAMFLAHAAALRSGQLARQVGAVIVSKESEVIAMGANDVPRYGGGLYWPVQDGRPDHRDHEKGYDSNDAEIDNIINDIVAKAKALSTDLDEASLRHRLKTESPVADLTEYGRPVHAEMEALLACARNGVNPRNGTVFTTTFPCHNCTKHIVAAGIDRVVYVEPYPKSKAGQLHGDSIAIDEDTVGKVHFQPFVGIAARRFFDLFSMRLSAGLKLKRKDNGKIVDWKAATATPRLRMAPYSYLDRELIAVEQIEYAVAKMDKTALGESDKAEP